MPKQLNWNKKTFSNLYKIFSNDQLIGNIKKKSFSSDAKAEIDKKRYNFITSGFFEPGTKIYDVAEEKYVGKIEYNTWRTKATIRLGNKTAHWKYDNIWNTKWSIHDAEGTKISYQGSSSGGNIYSNTDNSILLLSGLFITNYYWQTSFAVILIILIPILFNN